MTNNPNTSLKGKQLQEYLRKSIGVRVPKRLLPLFESVWLPQSPSMKKADSNERLGFLGESILNCILSEYMYEKFPLADSAYLEELCSRITHHAHLSRMAQRLRMEFQPSVSDEDALLLRDYIYSDILKACIGAVGLAKGFKQTQRLVMRHLKQQEQTIKEIGSNNPNYKGKIIAWGQRNKAEIRFKLAKEIKYKGKNLHIVSLYINNEWVSNGCDTLVKNAEQHASLNALETLSINNDADA